MVWERALTGGDSHSRVAVRAVMNTLVHPRQIRGAALWRTHSQLQMEYLVRASCELFTIISEYLVRSPI